MDGFLMFIDAANDAAMYPLARLRGITCAGSATVLVQFDSSVNGTADGDADLVTLTVTAGKEKAVMAAIAKQLTTHVTGALVVCDDVTGNHCHADISSCTILLESI
tara:strand:- start:295 stop:612 length:318 start_codon:yes stop_codon:yes gene_type:complete